MSCEVFFLPQGEGQRFCVFHQALHPRARGQIIYVHPFAEEMNKSRRMVAMQARALAQSGFDVMQIDLLGCGDSSGDFGDATWNDWVGDVVLAHQWIRARRPAAEAGALWLWGLRAGCLIATQAALRLPEPCNFLFWSATPLGKPLLQQFLRLKAAADMASGNAKSIMEGLRADLVQGLPVEVAGYLVHAEMARGLELAQLGPPEQPQAANVAASPKTEWFDLFSNEDSGPTPVMARTQEQWKEAGFSVNTHRVKGPAFWQTTELEDAPQLIAATTRVMAPEGQP